MALKAETQYNYGMSRVRDRKAELKAAFSQELKRRGISTYISNDTAEWGVPDLIFRARKIAVFLVIDIYDFHCKCMVKCDCKSLMQEAEQEAIRKSEKLNREGWTVLSFRSEQIKNDVASCVDKVESLLRKQPQLPYKMIDLCAGIGGIRRGFELAGNYVNVLAAEIDQFACMTYEHLFGENPCNDLTTEEFKQLVENTPYDVLLAGFPCQTFSRAGLGEGFENEKKGKIFFHLAEIIKRTRPSAFFLENVGHLVTHDKGLAFKAIISILETVLQYKVIGVSRLDDGSLIYDTKDFVRNSRDFGMPQNRPRTYIIGFDRERFKPERLSLLPPTIPTGSNAVIYEDLTEILEDEVEPKYYLSSGYLETLIKHRERQEAKGYGFGYRVVNEPGIEKPIANTLLATGGSGRERNLIYQPRAGISGMKVKGKKSPLNDKGIRVMTPIEWGKLQGFVNYAFLDENGNEGFSFPPDVTDTQKYKQLGNSVTIPVVEEMARFISYCLEILSGEADITE